MTTAILTFGGLWLSLGPRHFSKHHRACHSHYHQQGGYGEGVDCHRENLH